MDLQSIQEGSFDPVAAIRYLAGRVQALEDGATTDAGFQGASLTDLLTDHVADTLVAAGFDSPRAVAHATDEQIQAVKGIGDATLKEIRDVIPHQN